MTAGCRIALTAVTVCFFIAACEGPTAPDARDTLTPRFSHETAGDEYSLFFGDLAAPDELEISVSQTFGAANVPECPTFGDASGSGLFLIFQGGRVGGTLLVEQACFTDWSEADGYPEEAIVRGTASTGTETHDFEVALISNEFPSPGNFFPNPTLDAGRLIIPDLEIDEVLPGELHHEDQAF